MAVGYRNAAGVDFDDLFDFYTTGTPPAATGYRDGAGVDLAGRYQPIAFGSKGPDVGYRNAAGVDLSNLWAQKGSSSFAIPNFSGRTASASDNAVTLQPNVTATAAFNLNSDGTWSITGGNSQGAVAQPAPASGSWIATLGGVASDYDVLIEELSRSGSAAFVVSNPAGWVNLGTTRSGSGTLPNASANNANLRTGNVSWRIRIRRVATGVVVSDNTFNVAVATQGYL